MVNVIGLGYIGLPTALMLASKGTKVVGTDYNDKVVNQLRDKHIVFEEKGIKELFASAVASGIKFTTEYFPTDMYIIAVPSPYDKKSKKIDPSYIVSALNSVLKVCKEDAVIIIESTVSPGTIDRCVRPIAEGQETSSKKKVHLVHAPERIIPGNMIYELQHNSRTIGADDVSIAERVKALYSTFCEGEIVTTDIRTAEMTKVVENTFRDVNIAYANELLKICHSDKMDVYEIIRIANKHPRVNILSPGPGVGGHCISVDPWFLVGDYPGLANIILAARKINDSMPEFVLERIHMIMKENDLHDVTKVGLYGLTYKEDVDDVRESPTLQLLRNMQKHLASGIRVYDPWVKENIVAHQFQSFQKFLDAVDFVVIMIAHSELLENLHMLKGKIVLDTRNVVKRKDVYYL